MSVSIIYFAHPLVSLIGDWSIHYVVKLIISSCATKNDRVFHESYCLKRQNSVSVTAGNYPVRFGRRKQCSTVIVPLSASVFFVRNVKIKSVILL